MICCRDQTSLKRCTSLRVLLCWGPTSMATIQVPKNIGRVSYRQVGLRNLKCCSEIIWHVVHLQLGHRTSERHDPENPRVFLLLVRDVHVVHRPTDLQSGMSQMLKISKRPFPHNERLRLFRGWSFCRLFSFLACGTHIQSWQYQIMIMIKSCSEVMGFKNFGNAWSKSIVLENKVVLKFWL